MKAIVTIIGDDEEVKQKDMIVFPRDVVYGGEEIPIKTTYFSFCFAERLIEKCIIRKDKQEPVDVLRGEIIDETIKGLIDNY